jgi:hypothetical protein
MKSTKITLKLVSVIVLILASAGSQKLMAEKKAKLRLSVSYVKVMGQSSAITIIAKAKNEDGMQLVKDVSLSVYREFSDTSIFVSKLSTNEEGVVVFDLSMDTTSYEDTSQVGREYLIKAKPGDWYKAAKKKIAFIECDLNAELVEEDSTRMIRAVLTNKMTGEPISEEDLMLRVSRLFNPLQVGEDSYSTDENGEVEIEYDDNIPALKELVFEILLNDHDEYGTVICQLASDWGVKPEIKSTFDERTMWSPRSKTPLYLLIWPNLIIFGVWFVLLKLMFNLYKIKSQKPE